MKTICFWGLTLFITLFLSCSKDDGSDVLPTANANNDPIKGIITLFVGIDSPQDVSFHDLWAEDLEINWGDGNITHEITHRFSNRGNYKITISGTGIYTLKCGYGSDAITSIDVRRCPNLEYIQCYWSQISSIDLTNNPHLRVLYCDNCSKLSYLDLSKCIKLEHLSCRWCDIERIILGNSKESLKYIACHGNKISELDISGAMQLNTLSCSNNQLKELRFDNNNNLETINCNNNQIMTLNIGTNIGVNKVLSIDCMNNKIEDLKIISERHVFLECSNNNIKNIDVSQCLRMRNIMARYNQLENLQINGCEIIDVIDCSYNHLTDLKLDAIYNSLDVKNEWGNRCIIISRPLISNRR